MELCLSGPAGKKNVKPLCELLGKFEIPNYSIVDRDEDELQETSEDHITTTERDFEGEVVDSFFACDNQGAFIALLESIDPFQRATCIKGNSKALKSACAVYGVNLRDPEYDFRGYRSLTGYSQTRPNHVRLCMHGFHRTRASCLASPSRRLLVLMAFPHVTKVLFARPWGLNADESD